MLSRLPRLRPFRGRTPGGVRRTQGRSVRPEPAQHLEGCCGRGDDIRALGCCKPGKILCRDNSLDMLVMAAPLDFVRRYLKLEASVYGGDGNSSPVLPASRYTTRPIHSFI